IWIGIYPRPFLAVTEASVKQLLAQVHVRYQAEDGRAGSLARRSAAAGGREQRAEVSAEGRRSGAGETLVADRTERRHAR
ncbi:MAG TPA: hypothetical protein VN648_16645, partial [Candidatus Methylomirabilis sp.]|nr:hypothetical protein [Candidatus Methylomirabilis sp.]